MMFGKIIAMCGLSLTISISAFAEQRSNGAVCTAIQNISDNLQTYQCPSSDENLRVKLFLIRNNSELVDAICAAQSYPDLCKKDEVWSLEKELLGMGNILQQPTRPHVCDMAPETAAQLRMYFSGFEQKRCTSH